MIAIEEIDKLRKENLSLITVVTGEDLGQYSQLKERMMERVGYDKDDLTYSYFDMAEVELSAVNIHVAGIVPEKAPKPDLKDLFDEDFLND